MNRLVQLGNHADRRIALVDEPRLRLLNKYFTVHALAGAAIESGVTLTKLIDSLASDETLDYDAVYNSHSPWRLLSPVDHPLESARLLVSGTGLTHLGSAKNRQAMHASTEQESDSMKMFRWGVEHGRPHAGEIGVSPEWFYKGTGAILRDPGEPLPVPAYAEDGGEEAEIAGVYIVDPAGIPRRIGMTQGNEFSDHIFEKKNYLNLAGSKIRPCSVGPELVIDADFQSVSGEVSIERAGKTLWSKPLSTGEANMCHSLWNIEHHHFKYETHRRPGDMHIHYFGACALSFGDGIRLADGDIMILRFDGFGRALRNPLKVAPRSNAPVTVSVLT